MSEENFDRIAAAYDEALPPHVVEHYLAKRTDFIVAECPASGWGRCSTSAAAPVCSPHASRPGATR